jgi:hypothetical protein
VKAGDVVYVSDASAILGDVLSVDEATGTADVRWRATVTTENLDDLDHASSAAQERVVTDAFDR